MGVQDFLKANGVKNRTPLVKVIRDILGTSRFDDDIVDFLDSKELGLREVGKGKTLQEIDRFFFILPALTTLFNYKVDFNSKVLRGVKWRLDYADSCGFIVKDFLDKYLIEWGIYKDFCNLEGQQPRTVTDRYLKLIK